MKAYTMHPDLLRLLACIDDLDATVDDVPLADKEAVREAITVSLGAVVDPDSFKAVARVRIEDVTAGAQVDSSTHSFLASVWTDGFMTGAMFVQRGGHVDS